MLTITLPQQKIAIIDDEDIGLLKFTWSCNNNGYACRTIVNNKNQQKTYFLHQAVIENIGLIVPAFKSGMVIDHINRDKLNNTRSNLRIISCAKNVQNRKISKNNSTGYKGVRFIKNIGKYEASICCEGKRYLLGYFIDSAVAARAYDHKVLELKSNHSLNFPNGTSADRAEADHFLKWFGLE